MRETTTLNGKPKQDHLATLSTNSLHRHADATHESLLDDQADSAAASQAIHDVVTAVRTWPPARPALGAISTPTWLPSTAKAQKPRS